MVAKLVAHWLAVPEIQVQSSSNPAWGKLIWMNFPKFKLYCCLRHVLYMVHGIWYPHGHLLDHRRWSEKESHRWNHIKNSCMDVGGCKSSFKECTHLKKGIKFEVFFDRITLYADLVARTGLANHLAMTDTRDKFSSLHQKHKGAQWVIYLNCVYQGLGVYQLSVDNFKNVLCVD